MPTVSSPVLSRCRTTRIASYRKAKAHWTTLLDSNDGSYPLKSRRSRLRAIKAPCKEVALTGDEVNLLDFAFLKTNPADAGRYVNTGSVFTYDETTGLQLRHLSLRNHRPAHAERQLVAEPCRLQDLDGRPGAR